MNDLEVKELKFKMLFCEMLIEQKKRPYLVLSSYHRGSIETWMWQLRYDSKDQIGSWDFKMMFELG